MSVCQCWEAVPALSGESCSAVDGGLEVVAILVLVPHQHCVPVSIIQDPNKSWDLLSHTPGCVILVERSGMSHGKLTNKTSCAFIFLVIFLVSVSLLNRVSKNAVTHFQTRCGS